MIKTPPSSVGDIGLIPGSEMEILLAVWCAKKKKKGRDRERYTKVTLVKRKLE